MPGGEILRAFAAPSGVRGHFLDKGQGIPYNKITIDKNGTVNRMYFVYDASGPFAINANGTTYYYVKNAQGDITAIVNKAGTAVVTYSYDAWGNLLSIDGEYKNGLGLRNPLRYRGYVYDTETGFYYLQSRYCDPQIGRFINADAIVATGQGLLGNNMFAYCRNNPIHRKDSDGKADEKTDDLDGDPTDGNEELRGGSASTGSSYMPVSTWSGLRSALKDGAKGLSMAMGEKTATQNHHLFSDKHSKFSKDYRAITDEYGLDLDDNWNIRELNHHQGRHTKAYHEYAKDILYVIHNIAQGDPDLFLEGVNIFWDFLVENDWIPYGR